MNVKKFFKITLKHYEMGEISDSSVILAYYFLLSLVPILIVLITVLNLIGINFQSFFSYIKLILPNKIIQIIFPMINSVKISGVGKQLSINFIILIWSASRGVASYKRIVNKIYGIKGYNSIINRIISFVLLLLSIVAFVISAIFLEFGQILLTKITPSSIIDNLFGTLKWPVFIILLLILNLLIYYVVPNVNIKMRYIWLGSIISDILILLLSRAFSIIIVYFSHGLNAYKTLSAFLILMFWLYFIGMIVLIGAVLNSSVQEFKTGKITTSRSFNKIINSKKIIDSKIRHKK